MSVSFYGLDTRRPRTTPYGTFPSTVQVRDGLDLNLCNANARALLTLLGLSPEVASCGDEVGDFDGYALHGDCSVPEARRAVMRARATFATKAPALVRSDYIEHGAPRRGPGGVVELHPMRVFATGIGVEYLERKLEAFASLVEALAALGADRIAWS